MSETLVAGSILSEIKADPKGFIKALVQATKSSDKFEDSLDKNSKALNKHDKKVSKSGRMLDGLKGGLGNIANGFKNLAKVIVATGVGALLLTAGAIAGIGTTALNTASQMETMKVALNTAFQGNEKEASKAYDSIIQFATKTPYAVSEVMEAFIKLKNYGLDPSEEALTRWGDMASAMGKPLDQLVEAVADASTGEFERLKEFGIKSRKEGDKIKFTFRGVTTTVKNNSEDIQDYLMGVSKANFAGGMEAQSKTFSGLMSTMKDTFNLLFAEILVSTGLFDDIKNGIAGFTQLLIDNKDNIKDFVTNGVNLLKTTLSSLKGIFDVLVKGDYTGLIFGQEEDSNFIGFLFTVREAILEFANTVLPKLVAFWNNGIIPMFMYTKDVLLPAFINYWNTTLIPAFKTFNEQVIQPLVAFWNNYLVPAFQLLWNIAVNLLVPAIQDLWNKFHEVWSLLAPIVMPVLRILGIILGTVIVGAILAAIGVIYLLIKAYTLMYQGVILVINVFKTLWNVIKAGVSSALTSLMISLGKVIVSFAKTKSKIDEFWQRLQRVWDNIKNIDLTQVGKDILQGLINGMNNKVREVKDKAREVADSISGSVKDFLGIQSPSKLMEEEVGEMIPAGIEVGIEKGSRDLLGTAGAMSASIVAGSQAGLYESKTINQSSNYNFSGSFIDEKSVRQFLKQTKPLAKQLNYGN